ncbi:MAG TPA: bifunctional 3'-5' exonuclease/DNA polymerase [Streptosporangiaceae bacterium]|nr:bifunctional 3'-5' exonuclease/DNA polymerase [Streptosporangiaceae bacterium]
MSPAPSAGVCTVGVGTVQHNLHVRIAVVPDGDTAGLLAWLRDDGAAEGEPQHVPDVAAAIASTEQAGAVRWVWRSTRLLYPALLRAAVQVGRCHDVELTGALLAARDGPSGQPSDAVAGPADERQPMQLPFEPSGDAVAARRHELAALVSAHADQLRRISADADPAKFGLLAAAESAGGLAAAEMSAAGLPWRADIHDRLLTELLGPRPPAAAGPQLRPARLAELAAEISTALGAVRPVNPDSPAQLLKALAVGGIRVRSTRSAELRQIDHPVIGLLLEYKELARLHAANGWSWLDSWVSDGRFRPEYVVGGVVSGRWASRGGGALQIPKLLRQAVVADPGWALVVADAAQLEPRILAALAGDSSFAQAANSDDLYAAVAVAIGADRAKAKVALLSAMYGGTGGDGGQSLALLRRRFPQASAFVETAARAGEEGRVVRSVLGRTCPPPSAAWRTLTSEAGDPEEERDPAAGAAARARGRFTRNFVVQASAADWALVLLALLRTQLAAMGLAAVADDAPPAGAGLTGGRPQLVFFQHDEVVVHCPANLAGEVVAAIETAAAGATRLVFGATEVSFPMTTEVVTCYADAK